jgi:AAA+ superfamily predicted ATPase
MEIFEIKNKVKSAINEITPAITYFREKAVALGKSSADLYPEKLFRLELLRVISFLDSKEKLKDDTILITVELLNAIHSDIVWNTQSLNDSIVAYKSQNPDYFSTFTNDKFSLPSILEAAREYDLRNDTMLYERTSQLLFQIWNLLVKSDGKITNEEEKFLFFYNNGTTLQKFKNPSTEYSYQLARIYDDFFGVANELKPQSSNTNNHKPNSDSDPTKNEIQKNNSNPPEKEKSTEEILKELEELVGLASVKSDIKNLINVIQIEKIRTQKGFSIPDKSLHLVFTGNPSTGKTTIGRYLASLYKSLGVLQKGHLVETDRSGLVAGFVGQTATKTLEICKSALDGILFIDEAYALAEGGENDFGREAINTLLKFMEDNRNRIIVIVAGYTENMEDFIEKNPGLRSRFNKYIHFPDYTPEELIQIFKKISDKMKLKLSIDAEEKLKNIFLSAFEKRDKTFGNGRLARNIFEKTYMNQANRLVTITELTDELLCTIEKEDLVET